MNLQFKFAPATTRVVAGRKPGENALAMDRSALRHGPFAYPPDKDPGIAPPSESGDDDGSVSHGESEGRPSPSLHKLEMRAQDAKVGKDGGDCDGVVEDWEEDGNSIEGPPDLVSSSGEEDDKDDQHQNLDNFDDDRSATSLKNIGAFITRFEEMEKEIKELRAAASSSKESRPGSVKDFLQQDRNRSPKKLKLSKSSRAAEFYPQQSREIVVPASDSDNDSTTTDSVRTPRKKLLEPWKRVFVCKHSEHHQADIDAMITAALQDSIQQAGPISGQRKNATDKGSFRLTHVSNSFSLFSLHFPSFCCI